MRILMISPPSGGIDIYVDTLSAEIRKHGVIVDIDGSRGDETAYDVIKKAWLSSSGVKQSVHDLAARISFEGYDAVLFHFGKNDVEQYLPVVLTELDRKVRNPIYVVHFLSQNLFSQYLGDPNAQRRVKTEIYRFFRYYIFFGKFAKNYMEKESGKKLAGIIAPLPETHFHERLSKKEVEKMKSEFFFTSDKPVVYLPGYAANYKDYNFLLKSLALVKNPVRLVIAGRGWCKRLGSNRKVISNSEVFIIEKVLNSKEYKFLTSHSSFGIFPYRQPDNGELFQGSGTLPNFLFEGKACVALDDASLPEYITRGGIVTPVGDVSKFAEAIDIMIDPRLRGGYEAFLRKHREKFSIKNHADRVVSFLNKIVK
jgi:hypothetical protein